MSYEADAQDDLKIRAITTATSNDLEGEQEEDTLTEIFHLQKIYDERVQDPKIPRVAEILGTTTEKRLFNKLTWLMHEAMELQRECQMKWWKQPKPFDKDHAKEELIDILHFWVSAALELGMTSREVVEEYRKKNKVNHDRQDQGY